MTTKGIIDINGTDTKKERLIGGTVKDTEYGPHFYTVAHGLSIGTIVIPVMSPYGWTNVSTDYTVKDKTSKIGKIELEEIVNDIESDIAILKLPEYANIPELPFEPEYNFKMGDVIYLVGNPKLQGEVIRKGRIVDIDAFGDPSKPFYNEARAKMTMNCFGVSVDGFGGDSGYLGISEYGKLLGIATGVMVADGGQITYFKKIEEYYKALKKHYEPQKTLEGTMTELSKDLKKIDDARKSMGVK